MRSGDREVQEEEEDGNYLVFSFCYIFLSVHCYHIVLCIFEIN